MSVEIEQLSGYGLGDADAGNNNLSGGDLAMSDATFVSLAAGAFLFAVVLTGAVGYGTGYMVKRGFFCDARI